MGPGDRLRRHRDRRHRPRSRGSAAHGMARPRVARRDGLYGPPWRAPRTSRGAGARHRVRDHGAAELPASRRARLVGDARRSGQRVRIALCAGSRLPQGGARQAAAARRPHGGRAGPLHLSRVHRQRAGDGSRARAAQWPGLARQAHPAAVARRGLALLSRRAFRGPGPREGRAGHGALRHVRAVHRRMPDTGDRSALPARRAALRLLPDHRAPGRDSRRAAAPHGQPHLRLRRLPAGVPVEQVRESLERPGLRGAQRARWREARGALCLDRGGLRPALRGLAHPAHRARAMASQHRGGARQRAGHARSHRCPALTRGPPIGARARARALGAF